MVLLAASFAGCAAQAACTGPAALEGRIKAHPTAEAYGQLGNWFGDQKQFACAAVAFKSAVRLMPKSAQLNYLLGLAYFESGELNESVAPLEKSVSLDGSALKPHLLLATVLMRLSRPQEAAPQWAIVLKADPKNSTALHGLSQCLLAAGDAPDLIGLLHDQKLDEELTVDLALAYTKSALYDQATATLTTALKDSPDSVPLNNALVAVYMKTAQTDLAERVAARCYTAHPDDYSAQVSYMSTLVYNGDWEPAKTLGDKMMSEHPHSFDTLYLNGVVERQEGQYAVARDHLTAAEALNPDFANLRYNLGIALARLHDLAGAKAQLEKAIALGYEGPEAHFELANTLRGLGDQDGAKQQMVAYQAAEKEKDAATIATVDAAQARQALDKGDTQRAVSLYHDAFAATPKNAYLGYQYAEALQQANNLDQEHDVLEQVVAIDPTFALAQHQLGYLDSRRGDNASAEKHFRAAVESAPGFAQAWISLAATLGMESKFPEAQDAVAKALRLEPNNSEAQQLRHQLGVAQQSHN